MAKTQNINVRASAETLNLLDILTKKLGVSKGVTVERSLELSYVLLSYKESLDKTHDVDLQIIYNDAVNALLGLKNIN